MTKKEQDSNSENENTGAKKAKQNLPRQENKDIRELMSDVESQVGKLFAMEDRLGNVRSNILGTTDKLIEEYKVAEQRLSALKDEIAAKIEELKARPVMSGESLPDNKVPRDKMRLGEISDEDMDQRFDSLLQDKSGDK